MIKILKLVETIKEGFRDQKQIKDLDMFMDIEWCLSALKPEEGA